MPAPKPLPPDDEPRLVERIRQGDVRAFERLFAAHYAALCGFVASYVRSDAIAEELVADLFRWLWERRERWEVTGDVRTYLLVAARNRALDHLKHERIERRAQETLVVSRGERPPGMGMPMPSTDASVRAAELDAAIQRAIEALPERCRLAFTLRRQQHLSYVEIAAVMGTAVKTVEVQIGVALKALRKSLADWIE